jgi:hypothetical protein
LNFCRNSLRSQFRSKTLHPYFGGRTETLAKRRSFFKQSLHGCVSIAGDGSIETINILARMSAIAETSLNLWMVIAKMARPRKSRRIIVSVDGQAPRIRRPCDDRIPLDAERRPHGFPEEKLSGPCFLKPFSASHARTCRRQPQQAGRSRGRGCSTSAFLRPHECRKVIWTATISREEA